MKDKCREKKDKGADHMTVIEHAMREAGKSKKKAHK